MGDELKISAYAISVAGQGQNLDNVYVNGRYVTSANAEERSVINKVAHTDFQVYGVCDGQVKGGESTTEEVFPAAVAMQRLQRLQSVMTEENKIDKDRIWDFLVEANRKMKEYKAAVQAEEVQASFASLFLHGNRGLAVHLGDSRIYVIRGGRMLQITEDHLEATDLYKFGIISQKQAEVHKKNSHLTAYLGMDDIYDAEEGVFSKYFVFYPDDIFIICSDGITDYVNNEDLEQAVRSMKDANADEIAQALIHSAAGISEDDMSIVVLKVEDAPGNPAPSRGTSALPRRENFEKPVENEEPAAESETTKLSRIMQGVAEAEVAQGGETAAAEKYDDYDDEYDDYDDESIIDKILGNPKRLAIILGGILVVVVILIFLFNSLGGKDKEKDSSSIPDSSSSDIIEDTSSDVEEDTSIVTPDDSAADESDSEISIVDIDSSNDSDSSEDSDASEDSDTSEDSDVSEEDSEDESQAAEGTTIVIQSGDTMYQILVDHYGTFSEELLNAIEQHNNMDVDNLQVGQSIELPTLADLGLE